MVESEVDIHRLSWSCEVVSGSYLDIPLSDIPCVRSGDPQDRAVDFGEFGPLEVWPVDIKGVLFPSVLEPKEFSGLSLVFFWIDVSGDIGHN